TIAPPIRPVPTTATSACSLITRILTGSDRCRPAPSSGRAESARRLTSPATAPFHQQVDPVEDDRQRQRERGLVVDVGHVEDPLDDEARQLREAVAVEDRRQVAPIGPLHLDGVLPGALARPCQVADEQRLVADLAG